MFVVLSSERETQHTCRDSPGWRLSSDVVGKCLAVKVSHRCSDKIGHFRVALNLGMNVGLSAKIYYDN